MALYFMLNTINWTFERSHICKRMCLYLDSFYGQNSICKYEQLDAVLLYLSFQTYKTTWRVGPKFGKVYTMPLSVQNIITFCPFEVLTEPGNSFGLCCVFFLRISALSYSLTAYSCIIF
jgi:hypothetical protein